MYLYAVSVRFMKNERSGETRMYHTAAVVLAKDEYEATIKGMEEYKRIYKEEEGWHDFVAVARAAHLELVQKALGYYYDAPIDILGLPTWVFNKLYQHGIRDVGGALKLVSRGTDAFPTMYAVGDKTVMAVRKALEHLGYIANQE